MARGPLFQNDYSPQFSGHETFPLRYGWLKKAFDRVAETESETDRVRDPLRDRILLQNGCPTGLKTIKIYWFSL